MGRSTKDCVIKSLGDAARHNSNLMVRPEVILWPDPDAQWKQVIPALQKELPALLVYGPFDPKQKQGPAIWIKCMVAKTLPEANWPDNTIPIIYLPGIGKHELKDIAKAAFDIQPLLEYQYTGTLWTQENGKEWTILAFIQNEESGLGQKVAQDSATREAIKRSVSRYFEDPEAFLGKPIIDAEDVLNMVFPDVIAAILKWMCKGSAWLHALPVEQQQVFINICKTRYGFIPDPNNIKEITEKLGTQRGTWKQVWLHYANAPKKFPEMQDLLRSAKPDDLGKGMFTIPAESWPQVNEEKEDQLRKEMIIAAKQQPKEAFEKLKRLHQQHEERRHWVWTELGQAPLAKALQHLVLMTETANENYPSSTIEEVKQYYLTKGFRIDQSMRKALAAVRSDKDKDVIKGLISSIYKPWLTLITQKFQSLVKGDASIFTAQFEVSESQTFLLFVDAFRFELAEEFAERLTNAKYNVNLQARWSALPSLTPTAKPAISPIAESVSVTSEFNDFRPQLESGRDLLTANFRESLSAYDYVFVKNATDITPGKNHWQEIGDIDTKGHTEQSEIVKRVEELFEQVHQAIDAAFEKGIKKIKIVTDHGWLLLPGGLPKTELSKDLVETRWGRCALIKEGAKTDLLHLPWRWNPGIFIAYAPGISFFKKNEEYAHGGISIHECLVPVLIIENSSELTINAKIKELKWVNLKCAVTTEGAPDGYTIDMRSKFADSSTSIVLSSNKTVINNHCTVMADDDAESKAVTVVLMDESHRILDKKLTQVGG